MLGFPRCKQVDLCPNCFARDESTKECSALQDTNFNKKCPFYKTKEQRNKELEENAKRNKR